jgi:hypothetical protein
MRELEVKASAYVQTVDEETFEFRLLAIELAQALGVSTDELVAAIEADEANCRVIEGGHGQLVTEFALLNGRCRLRIMNPM